MSILLLGNGEQVSIMTAEGGECVIINYDYQQVVKLYPECKRLATLFVNYKDCCNIKVLATNGIPSNIWQGSIRYINRLADYEEFGINSWFVIDRPSPNSDFLYLGWTFGDFRLKSDLIETWNFDSGLSKVRPKAKTWKKIKGMINIWCFVRCAVFGPEPVTQISKARSINNCHCQNLHWQLSNCKSLNPNSLFDSSSSVLTHICSIAFQAKGKATDWRVSWIPAERKYDWFLLCHLKIKNTTVFPSQWWFWLPLLWVSEPCHVCLLQSVYTSGAVGPVWHESW